MRRFSIEFRISNFWNGKPTKEAENWFKIHWPWFRFWFMLLIQLQIHKSATRCFQYIEYTVRPHTNQIKHMSKLLLFFIYSFRSFGLFFVFIFFGFVRFNFSLSFVLLSLLFCSIFVSTVHAAYGAWIQKWRSPIKWSKMNDFTFWKSHHSIEWELNVPLSCLLHLIFLSFWFLLLLL